MTKIDIISGFLGAGKTTLIKKLIRDVYCGEKLVLIENEFGEIGIDGGFLQEAGIQINEMNSGCICCSLVGDFSRALEQVMEEMAPDRIIIEPSGVGKLSDVIRAVENANVQGAELDAFTTVADVNKCRMYMKNFGEFYNDQIEHAGCIFLSHTGKASEKKIADCVAMLREHNGSAVIVTTDWEDLDAATIREAMSRTDTLERDLTELKHEHEHHHHHHEHGEECHCHGEHHHHDHDEECHCHGEHHHHEHGEECHCHDEQHHHHEHHHDHHEHGDECSCGCGGHHHHHHHADEVFTSWGKETTAKFTAEQIQSICDAFNEDSEQYGMILRAKGIVAGQNGEWIHFDYVPGEVDVRTGPAGVIGRICVIGSAMNEDEIAALFAV